MKMFLYKKENDEEIYYKINDGEEEFTLNFEKIKNLSKEILEKKSNDEDFDITVSVENASLDIYKTTLDNIFKSIKDDEELFTLYTEAIKSDGDSIDEVEDSNDTSSEEVSTEN